MEHALRLLMDVDGALFVAIGLVVLAAPSPQPALLFPLALSAVRPFEDTRRLLAAMFLGSGLLVLVVGLRISEPRVLVQVAGARLASFATVAAINVTQLRRRDWKRAPLLVLLCLWLVLATLYGWLGWRAA